jgi:hypothetical protein
VVSSLKLYSPEEMFYIPSGFFVFLKMISRFLTLSVRNQSVTVLQSNCWSLVDITLVKENEESLAFLLYP